MLRLEGLQAECLFDQVLPGEVRELPEDLARLDELLADPALLAPIEAHWRAEAKKSGRSARAHGRPTIPMATYVRLMVIKQRTDWGYETLVKEVSDSLHLRRFCLIGITDRTPDESTVRKLTRRLGSETVAELTRAVIAKAVRERRFRARAARIDSTVVEADVRYPSDAMLCLQGAAALARQGRRLAARIGERANSVRNRSRAVGRRVRQISRTLARRTGEARQQVIALNAETGLLLRRSAKEARRLAALARSKARGRGAQAKLRAASAIEELAERWSASPSKPPSACAARRSPTGSSPSPTPTRGRSARARRASPTSSATWPRSARSRKTPSPAPGASSCRPQAAGNLGENTLLPETAAELQALELRPREVVLDGGFGHLRSEEQLAELEPDRVFVSGRQEPGSARTKRRLRRYRTGVEGRISHLKRGYGLRRSRLKGLEGQRTWTAWATFAYVLDTFAVLRG